MMIRRRRHQREEYSSEIGNRMALHILARGSIFQLLCLKRHRSSSDKTADIYIP